MKIKSMLLDAIVSLYYPRLCPACSSVLQRHEQVICLDCRMHLPETDFHEWGSDTLEHVFAGRVEVSKVAALFSYKKGTRIQSLLHNLKYRGEYELGVFLGEYYGKILALQSWISSVDLILPIPLHPKKEKQRGYNQSEAIVRGLSRTTGIPYETGILLRDTYTGTQTKKSRFSRWENVKGVFYVSDPEQIQGKNIMVCDDVLTTGATMEAAISKVREAESGDVFVVALATTQG